MNTCEEMDAEDFEVLRQKRRIIPTLFDLTNEAIEGFENARRGIAHAQGVALGGIAAAGLERSTGECLSNWHFVEGADSHAGLIPHMEEP